jgi:UDP-3-O-[3-hydroxymyristoyl] glucosamine N-acyltransferase
MSPLVYTIEELSKKFDFTFIGDSTKKITGLSPLDEPDKNNISYSKSSSFDVAHADRFGAIIIPLSLKEKIPTTTAATIIFSEQPYELLVRMIPLFSPIKAPVTDTIIHPTAIIDKSAVIGKSVSIGAYVIIGENCRIGDNSILHPRVTLYENVSIGTNTILHTSVTVRESCKIGSHCTIQPHAVIGADGFGYVPDKTLGLKAIPQVGIVVLEDFVDVGACSTIDRATLGTTLISHGTKVDNQVQVGHNTKIGKHSILCGQVGVAGSTVIGDQVVLGGGVGVADHLTIVSGTRVAAASQVIFSLKEKHDYMGTPATKASVYRRNTVELAKLHETIKDLKQQLKELREKNS